MVAIEAKGLVKFFGKTRALAGLDFEAPAGKVLSLLGPNGAGKTTAVRILTTLLKADAGAASVAGFDVVKDAHQLREVIGLTGQYTAVDELLTGRENLVMVGRLSRMQNAAARKRAGELLERMDLSDAAERLVKTYSGGMRRRLDLAASLLRTPKVIFLDEPTTGLDPRSRVEMWGIIRELSAGGTTVLLTTQYLEEADNLADTVVVIDHGRAIASGSPDELKRLIGGERVQAQISIDGDLKAAGELLEPVGGDLLVDDARRTISVAVTTGVAALSEAVRRFDGSGIPLDDLALRRPTLDEVFLKLTGHAAEDQDSEKTESEEGKR